jgi:cyclopropane-fatty-acyl-phospholipid synthase
MTHQVCCNVYLASSSAGLTYDCATPKTLTLSDMYSESVPCAFTLVFRNPRAVSSLVLARDPLRFAECYFSGAIDIEGDFFKAIRLKDKLESIHVRSRGRLGALILALRMQLSSQFDATEKANLVPEHGATVSAHSSSENSDAFEVHYDVSNDLYTPWLDQAMVYSCAYFQRLDDSLEDAQQAKLAHICAKLQLQSEDCFLHIGCSWGALAIYAAQHFSVRAHGVTLSKKQLEIARQRIAQDQAWRLYVAACALQFESGGIGIYQLLASKRDTFNTVLPLTCRYMHASATT